MRALGLIAILLLAGCAGVPIGKQTFLMLGVGMVRIDRQDRAVGVRTVSLGLKLGCREIALGIESSFCAEVPVDGNVAILEQGSSPNKHLVLRTLQQEFPDEVVPTARDR